MDFDLAAGFRVGDIRLASEGLPKERRFCSFAGVSSPSTPLVLGLVRALAFAENVAAMYRFLVGFSLAGMQFSPLVGLVASTSVFMFSEMGEC